MSLLVYCGTNPAQAMTCKQLFIEENSELAAIEKRLVENDFAFSRGFDKSKAFLKALDIPSIEEILGQLEPGAIWIDLGAGLAKFQRDFLAHPLFRSLQLKLIALGFKKPKDGCSV